MDIGVSRPTKVLYAWNVEIPRMLKVRQKLEADALADPASTLRELLAGRGFAVPLEAGSRVAIAVGSRGIDRLAELVCAVVDAVKDAGGEPFIVPAMGSHGGATEEGQVAVLVSLGVTWEQVGAPVFPAMETVSLGASPSGVEAFMARTALEADAVVVLNRVGLHTGYSGPVQSGLVKMIAVGLGKVEGARSLHRHGFSAGHLIGEVADLAISKAPPITGVAVVEDAERRVCRLALLPGPGIRSEEPALLELARGMCPRIPVAGADILIVDEMGKDISGIGMDPFVIGRGKDTEEPTAFSARRLVVLRLSEASGGNATGIGVADITTRRLAEAMDRAVTYRNVLTSGALHRARLPLVADTEREALRMAAESLGDVDASGLRVVRIRNTRRLEELQVSEPLTSELEGRPGIELGNPEAMRFTGDGDIV